MQKAWAQEHVRVSAGHETDLAGVDRDLWSATVRASMEMRSDFGISSGKSNRGGTSAHNDGRAIDINRVDGTRFDDMDASAAASLGNRVAAEIVNRLGGRGMEVFTPGMAFRLDMHLSKTSSLNLQGSHYNHVHVSVRQP